MQSEVQPGLSPGNLQAEVASERQDVLERAFQLAYFIFPERNTALEIIKAAINKLEIRKDRENHRSYWRDKHLKRGIVRISRDSADILQWLVLVESDCYEKQQEEHDPRHEDLVLRYTKFLVRTTTAMSSFHVATAMQRLLRCYSNSETQRVYEVLTDKYPGGDEYRRAKALLMEKLSNRFRRFLSITQGPHNETRFVTDEDQDRWAAFVSDCLRLFVPWSSEKDCLPADLDLDQLPFWGEKASVCDPNRLEILRCHTLIHPQCFETLARALALDPPETKWAIPRFHMEENGNRQCGERMRAERLSPEERQAIAGHLLKETALRKDSHPGSIRVVVEGEERGQMALVESNELSFSVGEADQMLEIWTIVAGKSVLLDWKQLRADDNEGPHKSAILNVNKTTKLVMEVSSAGEFGSGRMVKIRTRRTVPAGLPMFSRFYQLRPALLTVTALLLIGFGWLLRYRGEESHRLAFVPPRNGELTPTHSHKETIHLYALVPDEQAVRGAGVDALPRIELSPSALALKLRLPLDAQYKSCPLHATLRRIREKAPLLTQTGLERSRTGTGDAADLLVPAALLRSGEEYEISVSCEARESGNPIASFGFRVAQD